MIAIPLTDPNYTSRFNGTSGAAPLVSGVIALMLEANPNLTFRDVQEILVRSSRTTAWYESPIASRGDVITSGGAGAGAATGAGATGTPTESRYRTTNTGTTATRAGAPGGGLAVVEDFGDAPLIYPVLTSEGGARHSFDDTDANPYRLGTLIDGETDGSHVGHNALADDLSPTPFLDDEDGVFMPSQLVPGATATIFVDAPRGGILNAWIDYDPSTNLAWNNQGEHVIDEHVLLPGLNVIFITVPADAELGTTYARFRLTSQANQANTPVGSAPDGEVEDYQLNIVGVSSNTPEFGGSSSVDNFTTWQTNQVGPFRDVDPFYHNAANAIPGALSPYNNILNSFRISDQWERPLANPALTGNRPDAQLGSSSDPASGNDQAREFFSHYELMPGLFANGAGYTVSQGYGRLRRSGGYAHGVIDAELAVQMARQWHVLGQNVAPNTEKTVTTFVTPGEHVLAAEKMSHNRMLVPGGLNGGAGQGYVGYWNQYNGRSAGPVRSSFCAQLAHRYAWEFVQGLRRSAERPDQRGVGRG